MVKGGKICGFDAADGIVQVAEQTVTRFSTDTGLLFQLRVYATTKLSRLDPPWDGGWSIILANFQGVGVEAYLVAGTEVPCKRFLMNL